MMLVGSALKGFGIQASDGEVGTVSDFLFDDRAWKIRWMVVDTGGWLAGRKILMHPSAIGQPNYRREKIEVRLTKQQVEDSPDILSDAPVSRQMQTNLAGHYGWDPLWGGGNYFGGYSSGMGGAFDPLPTRFDSGLLETDRPGASVDDGDPHLRSVTAVVGYHIQAMDGPIGGSPALCVLFGLVPGYRIRETMDSRPWWSPRALSLAVYRTRRARDQSRAADNGEGHHRGRSSAECSELSGLRRIIPALA